MSFGKIQRCHMTLCAHAKGIYLLIIICKIIFGFLTHVLLIQSEHKFTVHPFEMSF